MAYVCGHNRVTWLTPCDHEDPLSSRTTSRTTMNTGESNKKTNIKHTQLLSWLIAQFHQCGSAGVLYVSWPILFLPMHCIRHHATPASVATCGALIQLHATLHRLWSMSDLCSLLGYGMLCHVWLSHNMRCHNVKCIATMPVDRRDSPFWVPAGVSPRWQVYHLLWDGKSMGNL